MSVPLASYPWRDFVTDGVAASGPNKPAKSEIRSWGGHFDGLLERFSPVTYGADPSGVSDSTAAFTSAIAALNANGRGVLDLGSGHYKITSGLVLPALDNISILGCGATITGVSSATSTILLSITGPQQTALTLVGSVSIGQTVFQLTSVAGIVVGDLLFIAGNTANADARGINNLTHIAPIISIGANTVTIASPVPPTMAIANADITGLATYRPVNHFHAQGFTLYGAQLTGTTAIGLQVWACRDAKIDIATDGFTSIDPTSGANTGTGVNMVRCYGSRMDVVDHNSGSGGAAGIYMYECTNCYLRGEATYSQGFAIQISGGSYNTGHGWRINHSRFRGWKIQRCIGCNISDIISNISGISANLTAGAIALGASYNNLSGIVMRCPSDAPQAANQIGLWFSDNFDTYNCLTDVIIDGFGVNLAVQMGQTDDNNNYVNLSVPNRNDGVQDVSGTTRYINYNGITRLPSFTVASAPTGRAAGDVIYVSNETGGAVPAFFDGTNWRRVTDRAVIS